MEITLAYKPPYRFDLMLDFLKMRAIPGVEKVEEDTYYRTLCINDHRGWISIEDDPTNHLLRCLISDGLTDCIDTIQIQIRKMFDLDCDPIDVRKILSPFPKYIDGIRVPGCMDPLEMSVRAILGQQITVKAATTLAGRYAQAFGEPITTDIEGLSYLSPTPQKILSLPGNIRDHLGPLGVIGRRADTIKALAQGIVDESLSFDGRYTTSDLIKRLDDLPGIGPWTAGYLAMRALHDTDSVPTKDLGLIRSLEPMNPNDIDQYLEQCQPYRSYAVLSIWMNEGEEKK